MSSTSPRPLRILYISTQGGGVGYYRCGLPVRALRDAGHHVTYFPPTFGFFVDMHRANIDIDQWFTNKGWDYDIIHTTYTTNLDQVTYFNSLRHFANTIHNRGLRMIVDIDDDPHNVPTYNTSFKAYTRTAPERKAVLLHLRSSDAVSVSVPQLVDVVGRDGRAKYVLENYCDPRDWQDPIDPTRGDDKSVRMLFTGGEGHLGDINTVREPIERAMAKYDGTDGKPLLRLMFLGCTPSWAAQYMRDKSNPHANRAFYIQPTPDVALYRRALRWLAPDILYAPLEANEFNKSKSLIKCYDAAFTGATFICADYPTYAQVPTDCSLKCSTPTQWYESICAAVEDGAMRKRLNGRLHQWCLDTRDIKDYIKVWTSVYAEVMSRPVVSSMEDIIAPPIYTQE